jgi:hypothetical protein
VYKHIFPDGKVYIGITSVSPSERWKEGFGYIEQRSFFKHIVKVGWDNIRHEIIASGMSEENARLMERELVSQEKTNALNVQHRKGVETNWTKQPISKDTVSDRKIKFREMSDIWLNKVRYKDTVPFDWSIEDRYIDFKYATEDADVMCFDVIRVPIPEKVTYSGLYDYLTWKLDFSNATKIDSIRTDKLSFQWMLNVANSLESVEQRGIIN